MVEIGTVTTLNNSEQLICRFVAKKRYENNRKNGVQNSKIGPQSNCVTDLNGVCGEMCFCKLFNLFFDLSIEPRSARNGEDFGDAVLPDGRLVDVKVTDYPNGRLAVAPWKVEKPRIDLYALMVGSFPTFTFKGFMARDELLRKERLGTLGHGPTYLADQYELLEWI